MTAEAPWRAKAAQRGMHALSCRCSTCARKRRLARVKGGRNAATKSGPRTGFRETSNPYPAKRYCGCGDRALVQRDPEGDLHCHNCGHGVAA